MSAYLFAYLLWGFTHWGHRPAVHAQADDPIVTAESCAGCGSDRQTGTVKP